MIKDFVAQVKSNGLARSNRYAVLFSPPSGINPDALRTVLLFCDQVQLPGINYSTVQNRSFGEFREVPYEKLYDPCNLSFYVDTDMKVKSLFDSWMNSIQDPQTRTFNYYNSYTSNMTIEVQDLNDKTRYQMTLYECYPKNIGSIQLDYNSKDVMKIQVQMQYKYWTAGKVETLANGQTISTSLIDKFMSNFTGFEEKFNQGLGNLQNFATGAVMNYGITKLPGLLRS
jgi:hypothetical protein